MGYTEPETVEEGLALLASVEGARCLAGGASLVAMMNQRRSAPPLLVSLQRIAELSAISASEEGVWLGAMCTHRQVAEESRLRGAMEVVRDAARQLAHPAIRNMATVGGSLGLADPATELPVALVAASALVEVAGARGRRRVPVRELLRGAFETSLARGELITRVLVPRGPAGARGQHHRYSRVDADYPILSIACVVTMEAGRCTHARVAVGSCGPVPLQRDEADQRLVGTRLEEEDITAAGALLSQAASPPDDVRGSAEYRRLLLPRLLGRALAQAREVGNG
ncbi:carbon-monoxide dehydrogenase medium subunit [Myxococcus fulvus]|uniref:Carbon monoxide dehydrogenase n=1 Tax=Myxococcus fulvus TaxID=33 RepID=A0A511T727_MYXFU|nr:FAD binding domain-containing protein [Myxococcus fulvus]GEN09976.1 carbon monoxide dehydrogenase [Myxococcus fulvus]SEU25546.1 carbon-monoxide dehydrogenase medium subunit [Myxococcus fulvus]